MHLLYLYTEEWTGRHAQEVQTLSTCVALAEIGVSVTLVTGGGERELREAVARRRPCGGRSRTSTRRPFPLARPGPEHVDLFP